MKRLLVATSNPGKLREVMAILAGLPIELVTLQEFPGTPAAREDGLSFQENAERKALHYARLAGLWTLADDSGLEVDALDGAPGVYSARYAGEGAGDAANNAKLVAELSGIAEMNRTARFRCVVVVARADGVLASAAGVFEGQILDQPRGHNGFGYDPHFLVPRYGLTSAEMPPDLKNSISHRARALQALRPELEQLLQATGAAALRPRSIFPS